MNERKLNYIMKDFITKAAVLTMEDEAFTEEVTLEKFIEYIDNHIKLPTKTVEVIRTPILRKGSCFCAVSVEDVDLTYEIRYNLEELKCGGSKQFRKHFVAHCPKAQGFANITLTLLHELGHHANAETNYGDYDRQTELEFIETVVPKEYVNFMYFLLPDEVAATQWAIEWLENAENRKLAKAFEKEFFKYYK